MKGKGVGLWDEAKNTIRTLLYQHTKKTKIGFFSLKVSVYGEKGVNNIYQKNTFMLNYRKISEGDNHDAT